MPNKKDYPRIKISNDLRHKVLDAAREQRKNPTESERILWGALRGKKLDGLKFCRQQPVGMFIVDFYNSDYRLVIEVDGPIHETQKDADRERQAILETLGLNILWVKAELVERDLTAVLDMIRMKIRELKLALDNLPSPDLGEGRGGSS